MDSYGALPLLLLLACSVLLPAGLIALVGWIFRRGWWLRIFAGLAAAAGFCVLVSGVYIGGALILEDVLLARGWSYLKKPDGA